MSIIKKNIYFICQGTSINDIINSINNSIKNKNTKTKKNLLSYLFSKKDNEINLVKNIIKDIKEYKLNKLFNIGIKELFLMQENNIIKNIIKNNKNIYTSLDFSSIESSLILYQSFKNITIYPLPYSSKNILIKNYTEYYNAKSLYGEYKMNTKKTLINKYWDIKLNNYDYKEDTKNIKKINSTINWKYCELSDKINKFNPNIFVYNLKKFEDILIDVCKNNDSNDIVIMSNPILILNILKKIKLIKFDSNKNIIENTSIWNIEVEIDIYNNIINYKMFNKIYPTPFNYKPLIYKSIENNYEYMYRDNKFILFNSLKPIPYKYLSELSFKAFSISNQNIIKKILKKNKNNNIHKMIKNNDNFSFNKFK